jgi:hypothetical protein
MYSSIPVRIITILISSTIGIETPTPISQEGKYEPNKRKDGALAWPHPDKVAIKKRNNSLRGFIHNTFEPGHDKLVKCKQDSNTAPTYQTMPLWAFSRIKTTEEKPWN